MVDIREVRIPAWPKERTEGGWFIEVPPVSLDGAWGRMISNGEIVRSQVWRHTPIWDAKNKVWTPGPGVWVPGASIMEVDFGRPAKREELEKVNIPYEEEGDPV